MWKAECSKEGPHPSYEGSLAGLLAMGKNFVFAELGFGEECPADRIREIQV